MKLQQLSEPPPRREPADGALPMAQLILPVLADDEGLGETLAAFHAQCDDGGLAARLAARGLGGDLSGLFSAAAQRLLDSGVEPSARVAAFFVPGRIEVLGKHTDYAGGSSLLGAVNKGFAVVTTARDDGKCRSHHHRQQ